MLPFARNREERFWVPDLDLNCRRWHPAKTTGVLRIASSVLHILSRTSGIEHLPEARGRKAAQEHFSEECFRIYFTCTGNAFLKSSTTSSRTLLGTHGLQQAWINSRNQTTIATLGKHRQPMFLHPSASNQKFYEKLNRLEATRHRLAEYPPSLYTKSFPFRFAADIHS